MRATLFAVATALYLAPAARADVIYTQDLQGPPPAFAISDPSRQQVAADDFGLSAGATITGVRWYGRTGVTSVDPPGPAAFRIEFFADGFGPTPQPGASLAGQTIEVGRTDVGTDAPLYAYSAALATPVGLAPGRYWLSVAEVDGDTPNVWSWAVATHAPGQALGVRRDDVGSWTLTDGDAAFALEGTPAAVAVPAPPAILLAGVGLLGWAGWRRVRPHG